MRLKAGLAPGGFGGLRWVPRQAAGFPRGCAGSWRLALGRGGLSAATPPLAALRFEGSSAGLKGQCRSWGGERHVSESLVGAELLPVPSFPSSSLPPRNSLNLSNGPISLGISAPPGLLLLLLGTAAPGLGLGQYEDHRKPRSTRRGNPSI